LFFYLGVPFFFLLSCVTFKIDLERDVFIGFMMSALGGVQTELERIDLNTK